MVRSHLAVALAISAAALLAGCASRAAYEDDYASDDAPPPSRLSVLTAPVHAVQEALSSDSMREGLRAVTPGPKPTGDFADIGYASWSDDEPAYRLYPGDEIEVQIPSAPELNKTLTVQPDGRIIMPLVGQVMVADKSIPDAQALLSNAYQSQLLRPDVYISVKTSQPLKVFVGGEVDKPGVYDMPGDIDALRAVIQAGGFRTSAKRGEVIVIRRSPDGRPMMRTVNLLKGINDPGRADTVPLRRFDIVYVPRSGISSAGLFVQQYIRDLLPVSVGFSYAAGNSQVYSAQP